MSWLRINKYDFNMEVMGAYSAKTCRPILC
jgi:hypothetical protein